MEATPAKQVIRDFSPHVSGQRLISATSEARRRTYVLVSIVGLALLLRVYSISLYPLGGDEYNSIAGAKDIQLNWNSITYAVLTHYWIRLGTSELWLRLPSAIFGTISVVILFKIGEKLGGWRTGVVAGLLAALSPFNIYHSQEMRFYSLFICASALFILATINYVDEKKTILKRAAVLIAGLLLLFSHFLGILALCAQSVVAVLASKSKWPKWKQLTVAFGLLFVMGLPLIPFLQQKLWQFYAAHAGVTDFSLPAINRVSTVNFAKAAFAGYAFVFGYHVYPLRLVLVTVGLLLCGLLVTVGTVRLWRESRWRMLPLIYLLTIFAVYFVLNSIGGRVASVIGPRHGAFVWPVFIILLAIGLNSFRKPVFHALLASLLAISVLSIWFGWKKDWTYGPTEDYRSAAEYALRWTTKDSALLTDGRSGPAVDFYFPRNTPRINTSPYLEDGELISQLRNQRLIFVTDDWEADRRREFDRLLAGLNEKYAYIDGRVDFPLFEYVLERKSSAATSGYSFFRDGNQLRQPLSIYGLEFQDLQLPILLKVKDEPLTVIGAYGLPDLEGRPDVILPLNDPKTSTRLVLLTNVVGSSGLPVGQPIAEVVIEEKSKRPLTFSLRLGSETASWDKQCERTAPCETVFQWHKRLAILGQNRYEGSLRDFQAGLHGIVLDLPAGIVVGTVTFHYVAPSGQLYIWGVALAA